MRNWQDDNLRTIIQTPPLTYTHDNLLNGVIVPGIQSLITAILAGLAIGGISALIGVRVSAWQVGFVAGALAGLASWLSYRNHWQWSVTATIETLLNMDVNGDGNIGAPAPQEPAHISVQLVEDANHQQFIDLPYAERLPALASSVLAGRQFSQALWVGNGHPFTRAEFETLRAELLKRGLMVWRNPGAPAQGTTLTPAGRAIFRRLANHSPALTSGEE